MRKEHVTTGAACWKECNRFGLDRRTWIYQGAWWEFSHASSFIHHRRRARVLIEHVEVVLSVQPGRPRWGSAIAHLLIEWADSGVTGDSDTTSRWWQGQRPISCYPVTKKGTLLSPTSSSLALPLRFHPRSSPPLRKRTENRRCWDCIIAPITVIIYTSILPFSLFSVHDCNQSHRMSPCSCDMQTRAGSFANDRFFLHSKSWGSAGERLQTSLNQVSSVSCKGSDLCVCVCVWGWGASQLVKPQGEVDGSPRVAPHTEDSLSLPELLWLMRARIEKMG